MDHDRFDQLTRLVASGPSRRGLVRGLGAAALGLSLGVAAVHEAAACKKQGKTCKKKQDCCSGACKGKKGKKTCKNTAGARGCTIKGVCEVTSCPDFPDGGCAVTIGGKPFCYTTGLCFPCTSDAQCLEETGVSGARCVSCTTWCGADTNFRACMAFIEPQ